MNQSVSFLHPFAGLYLAVTRPDNDQVWVLPGGKVEPGETLEEAVIREVREEVGLIIENPVEVFSAPSSSGNYFCTTFTGTVVGEVPPAEQLKIKYTNKNELISGPFGIYNRKLFDTIDPPPRPLLSRFRIKDGTLHSDPQGVLTHYYQAKGLIDALQDQVDYLVETHPDVTGHNMADYENTRLKEVIEKLEDLLFETLPWVDDSHEDRLYQRIKAAIPPWAGHRE